MSLETRMREGVAVTRFSIFVNVALAVAKCAVGAASGSHALIADGIHSVVDFGSDIATMVGLKLAAKPGDREHPYGHHRFVTLITLGVSCSVLAFCLGLAWNSLLRLGDDHASVVAGPLPIAIAGGALVLKDSVFLSLCDPAGAPPWEVFRLPPWRTRWITARTRSPRSSRSSPCWRYAGAVLPGPRPTPSPVCCSPAGSAPRR